MNTLLNLAKFLYQLSGEVAGIKPRDFFDLPIETRKFWITRVYEMYKKEYTPDDIREYKLIYSDFEYDSYYFPKEANKFLVERFIIQIISDLTIGRDDNDEAPYTTDDIKEHLINNKSEIYNKIYTYIQDAIEVNDFHDLYNPEDGWIREVLY